MLKNIILFIALFFISTQSLTMELTQPEHNRNVFSQLPNKIRKQILLPQVNRCANYKEVKDILLSVGLVSKKSYAQINCIFFITDVIKKLSKKWKRPSGTIALHLATPGSLHYKNLGDDLYRLAMSAKHPREQVYQLYSLLRKNADINFQTAEFNTTPLIKATHKSNLYLVFYLIHNGADVNAQSNNKYVREHSVLYDNEELESYFSLLAQLLEKE